MAKVWRIDEGLLGFHCPGCHYGHCVPINGDWTDTGKFWEWNGSYDAPSFKPSILVNKDQQGTYPRCHSIITQGRIFFCADSTHALAGQTVDMPEDE